MQSPGICHLRSPPAGFVAEGFLEEEFFTACFVHLPNHLQSAFCQNLFLLSSVTYSPSDEADMADCRQTAVPKRSLCSPPPAQTQQLKQKKNVGFTLKKKHTNAVEVWEYQQPDTAQQSLGDLQRGGGNCHLLPVKRLGRTTGSGQRANHNLAA